MPVEFRVNCVLRSSGFRRTIYLDWQSRVARWARHDERRSERVHLVQSQGHIERRRERTFTKRSTDVRRVSGFHRQDGPSGRQVRRAHDIRRSAQVGADAHALKHRGSRDEAHDIGDAEIVRAGGHGGRAGFGERGGQEGHVRGLVRGDFLKVGVEGRVEAGGRKLGFSEILEPFLVEGVFEVLEG